MLTPVVLALGLSPAAGAPRAAPPRPKLVVVITVDQLRADYLVRWRQQLTGGPRRGTVCWSQVGLVRGEPLSPESLPLRGPAFHRAARPAGGGRRRVVLAAAGLVFPGAGRRAREKGGGGGRFPAPPPRRQ